MVFLSVQSSCIAILENMYYLYVEWIQRDEAGRLCLEKIASSHRRL